MSNTTAKFPKGVPMSIEDVAAVVGDAFQEMNENPPPSVVKVREEMENKKASSRERLTWAKSAEVAPGGLYGYTKGVQRSAETASRKLARHALQIAKRAFNKDAGVVEFLQTHAKRENSKSARVLLAAMEEIGPKLAKKASGSYTARPLKPIEQRDAVAHLRSHKGQKNPETGIVFGSRYKLDGGDYLVYDFNAVGSGVELVLLSKDGKAIVEGVRVGDHSGSVWSRPLTYEEFRQDPTVGRAYGQYVFGLMHENQQHPEIRRLADKAKNILEDHGFNQWGVVIDRWPEARQEYLSLCKEHHVTPEATEGVKLAKTAGAPEYGLYGYKAKTADLGLDSCKEVRTAAGRITADLHRRKGDLHEKLTGFWKEHAKQAKCAYAGMLLSCYPEAGMKFAARDVKGSVLPGTNQFVHASSGLRAESGSIQGVTPLPTEMAAFMSRAVPPIKMGTLRDVHVSAFPNETGTRDADGVVTLQASNGVSAEVGFTATYAPGPKMTVLASGDWIEWEE